MSDRAAKKIGDDATLRVARMVERLSDEYAAVLAAETGRMETHLARMRAAPEDGDAPRAMFRIAHDIKGQAATFDRPLAGAVAGRLCGLLREAAPGDVSSETIAAHVALLRRVVDDRLRGAIDADGAALLERLDRAAGLR